MNPDILNLITIKIRTCLLRFKVESLFEFRTGLIFVIVRFIKNTK
jgi:hypothetical protein